MKYNNVIIEELDVKIMKAIKSANRIGIVIAIILIILGVYPFFSNTPIVSDVLASSIILILIGVGYIISVFVPKWNKAIIFCEGVIIAIAGSLLEYPYNYWFYVIGILLIILAALAYTRRLPNAILRFFYR